MATKKKSAKVAAAPNQATDADFRRRSKAAKKGWATRRRNAVKKRASNNQRKLKNAQLGLPEQERKSNSRIKLAGKSKKELEKLVREQEQRIRTYEMTESWVDAMPEEYLSRDGHIALKPSRARHDEDYWDMRERLDIAYAEGEDSFDTECYDIAVEYDYEVREIYTLFFSP